MKKIHATKPKMSLVPQPRSLRRFIKQMFAGLLKRQHCDGQKNFQTTVLEKLQGIGDSIEIMVREMARQVNRDE